MTIEDLSTGFALKNGKNLVLHQGITATVNSGQLIAVMGPNGAGKTTLLKTLLGLNRKLSGNIYYDNAELEKISIKELARKTAVVLTEKPDDIYLSTEEIILSGRYPYGTIFSSRKANDKAIAAKAADITNITALMKRRFYTLSDGEKQRVMIARALTQDTPLILLDEPTAFIDSPGKVEILGLLKKIAANGKGVVMTIHDVELALQYADILWLLGKNGFFETGEPGELIRKGSINKIFDTKNVVFEPETSKFVEKK